MKETGTGDMRAITETGRKIPVSNREKICHNQVESQNRENYKIVYINNTTTSTALMQQTNLEENCFYIFISLLDCIDIYYLTVDKTSEPAHTGADNH